MTRSFYDVLGVSPDATTDEIETAYRERLKETHPDVSDDDDAGQATKTLIEARDVLVDEDERARYDRVGHDAYVGDEPEAARNWTPSDEEPTDESSDAGTTDDDAGKAAGRTESRASRERRARERVRQERRKARQRRRDREQSRQREQPDDGATASGADATGDHSGGAASGQGSRATDRASAAANGPESRTRDQARAGGNGSGPDPTGATATSNTYSVREDVATTTSHGRLWPKGQELTLLGIFFMLYPVLVFSALLPAFPPFVNVVLSFCTLLTIAYLQSIPRVALVLFGGWSAISVFGLAIFGVGFLSTLGVVVLASTLLPFAFSVLTSSALRY